MGSFGILWWGCGCGSFWGVEGLGKASSRQLGARPVQGTFQPRVEQEVLLALSDAWSCSAWPPHAAHPATQKLVLRCFELEDRPPTKPVVSRMVCRA